MFNGSFRNIRSRLRENALGHIADDLRFTAFITLEHSHRALFGGMRTPSRPTPDMYGPFASSSRSRRPINLRFSTRVTRVTTYSEGSTQKSPSGCIKGRKGKWLKHQNIWTKNNCAQRQEICDCLPKSLVVGFVSKRLNDAEKMAGETQRVQSQVVYWKGNVVALKMTANAIGVFFPCCLVRRSSHWQWPINREKRLISSG